MRILIFILLFSACAERQHVFVSTGQIIERNGGGKIIIPIWLNDELIQEACNEIETSGLPVQWNVIIELPVFEAIPGQLARGMTDYKNVTIHVGWRMRPYEDYPLLPALSHEVNHVLYGPNAGHSGEGK